MLLWAFFLCVSCTQSTSDTEATPVFPEELKWIGPNADRASHLTVEPSECLPSFEDSDRMQQIALGRLAFRSPYLLGGQATRRGLSCQSCHTNGDINADFFIDGLSGEPGTADVTSFHFSSTLGDETFNPKPIPSLVSVSGPLDQPAAEERKAFILRLVEMEFDGKPQSKTISDALVTYVNSLDSSSCSTSDVTGRAVLRHHLGVIDAGVEMLTELREYSPDDVAFIQSAVRNELGRLSNRYPENTSVQEELIALSMDIKNVEPEKEGDIASDWQKLKTNLNAEFERSFYNADYVNARFP